jgi:hypothetical protein
VSAKALLELACWCGERAAAGTTSTAFTGKHEQGGLKCPHKSPPREPIAATQAAMVVPLEQLWMRLPRTRQQELIGQLTRVLTQRLTPPNDEEKADG